MKLLTFASSSLILAMTIAFVQVAPTVSLAGQIREASDMPQCDYFYSGEVEEGDAQKIEDAIHPTALGTDLCFDSPGGSFQEGIKMFYTIWNMGSVRTRVVDGDICMSACAIAFMGGSMLEGTGVIRFRKSFLEPGSRLGFHSPILVLPEGGQYSGDAVISSYALALESSFKIFQITQINENGVEGMSEYLFGKILETPPSNMFVIDTIGKASLGKIHLSNVPIRDLVWDGIRNVCDTAYLLADTGNVTRDGRPYEFSDFSNVGDDGTGRPIQIEDRTWSWSTERTMEFVVRGYPAAHKSELFCRASLLRNRFDSERELSLGDRSDEYNRFGITLWYDAYVPNDETFAQYAEGNSRSSYRLAVPWAAMWPPYTRLDNFK